MYKHLFEIVQTFYLLVGVVLATRCPHNAKNLILVSTADNVQQEAVVWVENISIDFDSIRFPSTYTVLQLFLKPSWITQTDGKRRVRLGAHQPVLYDAFDRYKQTKLEKLDPTQGFNIYSGGQVYYCAFNLHINGTNRRFPHMVLVENCSKKIIEIGTQASKRFPRINNELQGGLTLRLAHKERFRVGQNLLQGLGLSDVAIESPSARKDISERPSEDFRAWSINTYEPSNFDEPEIPEEPSNTYKLSTTDETENTDVLTNTYLPTTTDEHTTTDEDINTDEPTHTVSEAITSPEVSTDPYEPTTIDETTITDEPSTTEYATTTEGLNTTNDPTTSLEANSDCQDHHKRVTVLLWVIVAESVLLAIAVLIIAVLMFRRLHSRIGRKIWSMFTCTHSLPPSTDECYTENIFVGVKEPIYAASKSDSTNPSLKAARERYVPPTFLLSFLENSEKTNHTQRSEAVINAVKMEHEGEA